MSLPRITAKKINLPKLRFNYNLVVLILLTLNFFTSCGSFLSAGRSSSTGQSGAIFIQTVDGNHIEAKSVPDNYRNEKNVEKYARRWVTGAWTWTQPDSKENPNHVVMGTAKIPLPLYYYSRGMNPGYSDDWLNLQADIYQEKFKFDDYIFDGKQSHIRILKSVIQETQGGWEVSIVANRIHTNDGVTFATERFNRKLKLIPVLPVSKEQLKWLDGDSPVARNLQEMQSSGLLIIEERAF